MSEPAAPDAAVPADLQSRIDSIPELPPQGFAPHVELDENGRIVFAPPASLDSEGNNLPRLRNLLPELITTADALRDLLARGNQAHAALIRRLAAYRAQLHADLADVTLARVLAEGIRLENAAAAARTQIAAGELPPHDEEAEEALESLLAFNRMFVMATADGPAMLADEARYRRTPAEDAALQSTLVEFAATASEDPAAVAPDVAETLYATVSQSGDSQEASRTRRLGERLAGNILITATYAATLATLVAYAATAAGVVPAGLIGWLGYKTIEKTKAYAATIEAGAKVLDKARDLDGEAATRFARDRLGHAERLIATTRSSVESLARQDGRFGWIRRPLQWLAANSTVVGPAEPPSDFSLSEVRRRVLSDEPIPNSWLPFIRALDFHDTSITSLVPISEFFALRQLIISATSVTNLSPLRNLTSLTELQLHQTRVTDLTPIANLTDLQALWLLGTPVSDLSKIAGLVSLEQLVLNYTSVSDLSPLVGLTKLNHLHIDHTAVQNLSPIADLTELKVLELKFTPVTDLGPLTRLTALQSLELDHCQVTNLAPLANLTALQALSLSNTAVTNLAPLAALTAMQSLNLADTQVTDLRPLSELINLQSLDLDSTSVTDLIPLATLPFLRRLNITGLPKGIESTLPRRAEIEIIRRR